MWHVEPFGSAEPLGATTFFIIWFCCLYFWSPIEAINACLYGSVTKNLFFRARYAYAIKNMWCNIMPLFEHSTHITHWSNFPWSWHSLRQWGHLPVTSTLVTKVVATHSCKWYISRKEGDNISFEVEPVGSPLARSVPRSGQGQRS